MGHEVWARGRLYDDASRRYEETFTATQSGRLVAYLDPWFQPGTSTFQGGFTLQLYLVWSSPAPAPGAGPGSGSGAPQAGLDVIKLASGNHP